MCCPLMENGFTTVEIPAFTVPGNLYPTKSLKILIRKHRSTPVVLFNHSDTKLQLGHVPPTGASENELKLRTGKPYELWVKP